MVVRIGKRGEQSEDKVMSYKILILRCNSVTEGKSYTNK